MAMSKNLKKKLRRASTPMDPMTKSIKWVKQNPEVIDIMTDILVGYIYHSRYAAIAQCYGISIELAAEVYHARRESYAC